VVSPAIQESSRPGSRICSRDRPVCRHQNTDLSGDVKNLEKPDRWTTVLSRHTRRSALQEDLLECEEICEDAHGFVHGASAQGLSQSQGLGGVAVTAVTGAAGSVGSR
jgi:hypothetical protein